MKPKKMLNKLKDILSAERHAQLEKYTSLKKLLKSLRIEKRKLKKELSDAVGEESRHEIANRLKVLSVQRKKGLKVLKELQKERKQQNS